MKSEVVSRSSKMLGCSFVNCARSKQVHFHCDSIQTPAKPSLCFGHLVFVRFGEAIKMGKTVWKSPSSACALP